VVERISKLLCFHGNSQGGRGEKLKVHTKANLFLTLLHLHLVLHMICDILYNFLFWQLGIFLGFGIGGVLVTCLACQ